MCGKKNHKSLNSNFKCLHTFKFLWYFTKTIFRSTQKPVKITLLPYYGGAKGHTLQIAEMPNGKVTTTIIKTPTTTESTTIEQEEETTTQLIEIEYPQLPTKHDYSANLKNIHQNALNIIKLQEQQKTQGSLTETEQQIFKESVDSLHESSDNLARLQEHDDDYEDDSGGTLESWFERKKNNKVNKEQNKNSEKNKEGNGNSSNNNNNKESGQKEEEEGDGEDGIAINLPPEDASVAEAKPVGLAIAGENI